MKTGKLIKLSDHPTTWSHFDLDKMYHAVAKKIHINPRKVLFWDRQIGSLNQHMLNCFIGIMELERRWK